MDPHTKSAAASLAAISPCVCCGYSGENFARAMAHKPKCPMHKIDSLDSRAKLFEKILSGERSAKIDGNRLTLSFTYYQ